MNCQKCGAALNEGAVFCVVCGAPVESGGDRSRMTPPVPYAQNNELTRPLSTPHFLGLLLLSSVPIVGLILYIIWGFSPDVNVNVKNFSRAALIMQLIGVALAILIIIVVFSFLAQLDTNGFYDDFYSYYNY